MQFLIFRQPLFAIARTIWRPLLSPILGTAVTYSPLYTVLWGFAAFSVSSLGLFRGIRIMFSIRRYLLGTLTISHLTNIISNMNPIVGFIFVNTLKDQLIGIARTSISRRGFISLISFIIFNSFFLIVRSIFYLGYRILIYLLLAILTVFWVEKLSNIKKLLALAFDAKEWIEDHFFPNGISIPIPKSIVKPEPYYHYMLETLYNIGPKIGYSNPKIIIKKEESFDYRFGNIEELFHEHIKYETLSDPLNNILLNTQLSTIEMTTNYLIDFLSRILLHSFIEFNLFL